MSPIITFTERDLLRGKPIEPAWYVVKMDEVGEGTLSSKGDSTNYQMEGTVIKNADTGDVTFAGTPLDWNLNSKLTSAQRNFLEALGVEVKAQRYELKNAIGKSLEIFVENDEWQGRILNRVNHKYRPLREHNK